MAMIALQRAARGLFLSKSTMRCPSLVNPFVLAGRIEIMNVANDKRLAERKMTGRRFPVLWANASVPAAAMIAKSRLVAGPPAT
jgi:hypothetical protein